MKTTLSILFALAFCLMLPYQAAAYVFSKENDRVTTTAHPLSMQSKKSLFLEKMVAKMQKKYAITSDTTLTTATYEMSRSASRIGAVSLICSVLSLFIFSNGAFLGVLGVIAFLITPILGIMAIAKGLRASKRSDVTRETRSMAKKGIVLGVISLLALIGILVAIYIELVVNFK